MLPRPSRGGTGYSKYDNWKQVTKDDNMFVLLTVHAWMWSNLGLTYKHCLRITQTTSRLESYDTSYLMLFSYSKVMAWNAAIEYSIKNGVIDMMLFNKVKI